MLTKYDKTGSLKNIKDSFTFSEEEQWTGDYWLDGKKIYIKTWVIGKQSGQSLITLDIDIDIDLIWCDFNNSFYIEAGSGENIGNIWTINGNLGTGSRAEYVEAGRGLYYNKIYKRFSWYTPYSGISNAYITYKYTKQTDE